MTPLRYSVSPTPSGWDWQCLECISGQGSAPLAEVCHVDASIHLAAAHSTMSAGPRRARWGWPRLCKTKPRRAA